MLACHGSGELVDEKNGESSRLDDFEDSLSYIRVDQFSALSLQSFQTSAGMDETPPPGKEQFSRRVSRCFLRHKIHNGSYAASRGVVVRAPRNPPA